MRFIKNFFILILSFFIASCSFSKESKYRDLIKDYKNGKISDISEIKEFILKNFSILAFENKDYFFNKSILLKANGSKVSFLFPKNIQLKAEAFSINNVSFADLNETKSVIGNDSSFGVFDLDGNLLYVHNTDKRYTIDALSLRDNEVIFFTGTKLKIFDLENKNIRDFNSGSYTPPYQKFYKSMIISSDKYLSLISGIAGAYYINIFDATSGVPVEKNISAASFEFNQGNNYVLYIRGTTGNWTVVKFDINNKKRTDLLSISKLTDIFIAQSGFIYMADNRLHIANLSGERYEIPMEISIRGICKNAILVEDNSKIYLIDFDVFMEKIKEFHSM